MSGPSAFEDNPFFVLELTPAATRMEVERAGQKLLAQLAVQVTSAKAYRSPFGPRERDEDKVRAALTALRNPAERVLHELWFCEPTSEASARAAMPAWEAAWRSIGWRGPCPR